MNCSAWVSLGDGLLPAGATCATDGGLPLEGDTPSTGIRLGPLGDLGGGGDAPRGVVKLRLTLVWFVSVGLEATTGIRLGRLEGGLGWGLLGELLGVKSVATGIRLRLPVGGLFVMIPSEGLSSARLGIMPLCGPI